MAMPLRILIVEDDEDARATLTDILAMHQHDIAAVGSLREAFAKSRDIASFDLIILDRRLPDGIVDELLPEVSRHAPDADVIVVTAFADLDGTIRALREGVTDYILKPINPDALLATLNRIGTRRRIQRELQRERRFAENVLATAEAIILVLDAECRVMRFNPYLTQLTGFPAENLTGKNWIENFIPVDQQKSVRRVFDQSFGSVATQGFTNAIKCQSGDLRQIRWSNTCFYDELGGFAGVLSVGLDVTDLLRAQEKVLQTERLATIGQTMTGLAHESRNALQRLQNAVELLEDDLQGQPQALKDLAKIEQASRDLRDLLEEVRAYAAPIQLNCSTYPISRVWNSAWHSIQARRSGRQAELEVDDDNSEIIVSVDARRLEQVFRNLFENALDACPDPLRVTIRQQTRGSHAVIEVEDNGPGVSAESLSQIFDAFYTTKATGTGLGLAIAHRIVEAHHGTLSVRNTGRGCCFTVTLPGRGKADE